MFEPVKSWSLPDHLYMVSAWSAKCRNRSPMSCVNDIVGPYGVSKFQKAVDSELAKGKTSIDLAWTDITWLLYANHISWRYYVQAGVQPDCDNDSAETCAAVKQNVQTPRSGIRCRCSGTSRPTTSCTTSSPPAPTCTRPRREPCPQSAGWSPRGRTAITRPPAFTGGRRT